MFVPTIVANGSSSTSVFLSAIDVKNLMQDSPQVEIQPKGTQSDWKALFSKSETSINTDVARNRWRKQLKTNAPQLAEWTRMNDKAQTEFFVKNSLRICLNPDTRLLMLKDGGNFSTLIVCDMQKLEKSLNQSTGEKVKKQKKEKAETANVEAPAEAPAETETPVK